MLDEILCPDENVTGERARDEGIGKMHREVKRKLHFLDDEFQLLHPRGNHSVTSPVRGECRLSLDGSRAGPPESCKVRWCIINRVEDAENHGN